jgi:hypothetical protein
LSRGRLLFSLASQNLAGFLVELLFGLSNVPESIFELVELSGADL